MPKKSQLKCYFGCVVDGPLHKFPSQQFQTFNQWKAVLELTTQEKGDNHIYNMVRLCYRHFEERFKSTRSHLLIKTAVPTLNLVKYHTLQPTVTVTTEPLTESALDQSQNLDDNKISTSSQTHSSLEKPQPSTSNISLQRSSTVTVSDLSMWVLKACRACLTTEGRLEKIDPKFKRIFCAVTNLNILEGDGLPTYFCMECLWSLKKAMVFRRRSQRAYYVFKEIKLVRKQVTLKDLEDVDRKKTNLISPYSLWAPKDCVVYNYTTPDAHDNDIPAEENPEIKQAIKESLDSTTEAKNQNQTYDFNLQVDKEKGIYNLEIKPLEIKEDVQQEDSPKRNADVINNASILIDIKPANYKEIERQEEEERQRIRQKEIETALKEIGEEEIDTFDDGPCDEEVPEDIDLDDVFKGLPEPQSDNDTLPEIDMFLPKKKKKIKQEVKTNIPMDSLNSIKDTAKLLVQCQIRYMTHQEQIAAYSKRIEEPNFKRSVYRCALCVTTFTDMDQLLKHVEYHEKKVGFAHICDICQDKFHNDEALLIHQAECHWYEYGCGKCSGKHYSLDELNRCCEDGANSCQRQEKIDAIIETLYKKNILPRQDYNLTLAPSGKESIYYCAILHHIYFENQTKLVAHMKEHSVNSFKCNICASYFSSRTRLFSHISYWHQYKYTCNTCEHECYNMLQAEIHASEHINLKEELDPSKSKGEKEPKVPPHKLDCNFCGTPGKTLKNYYIHQLTEHRYLRLNNVVELNDPEFHCTTCDVYFMNKKAFFKHLVKQKHQLAKSYEFGCRQCCNLYESKQELEQHDCSVSYFSKWSTKHSVYPKKCCYCDEMLDSFPSYKKHFNRQHGSLPYRPTKVEALCEICGKELAFTAVKAHIAEHKAPQTPTTDFSHCRYCNLKFHTPVTHVTHILNKHTWKPFKCALCDNYRFPHRCDLRDHVLKVHGPVRPYRCEACDRRFSHLDYLHDHCLKVHRTNIKQMDKTFFLNKKMRGKVFTYPHMKIDGSLINPEILEQTSIYMCDYVHENAEEVSYKDYFFFDPDAVCIERRKKNKNPNNKERIRIRKKKKNDEDMSGFTENKKIKKETDVVKRELNEISEVKDAVRNLPKLLSDESKEFTFSDYENTNYSIKADVSNIKMENSDNYNEESNLTTEYLEETSKDEVIYEVTENICVNKSDTETVETEDVMGQLIEKDGEYYVLVEDQLFKLE